MSAKTDILAAIAKTDDQNMKTVMILLLAVLDEISEKIDRMRDDEQGLREAVLNGHAANHDEDHVWVQGRRKAGNCDSTCKWVADKIQQEKDDLKDDKASRRSIRDGLIEWGIRLALIVLAGAAWLK